MRLRLLRPAATVLVAATLAAACTTPTDSPIEPSRAASPEPTEALSGTADGSAGQPSSSRAPGGTGAERPGSVTLAFAGDVHFEGRLRDLLDADRPLDSAALRDADLAMVNLETSVGTGGAPDPEKRFTFQAPPSAFDALARSGIDVATLANNHALDFGREPLPGTFRAIDAAAQAEPSLTVVGLGRNARAAFAPATSRIRGTTVATLGATVADADPTADPTGAWAAGSATAGTADAMDPALLLRSIERANADADVVVVYLHWGVQGRGCPTPEQRRLARRSIAAGADLVVGSHAHRLQGDGRLGDGYVAYGLGNYAWYTQGSAATATTGVLTVRVRPADERGDQARVTRARWEPARIGVDGRPAPLADRAAFDRERERLRGCAGLG